MKVYESIVKKLEFGKIHMTLIDPATSGSDGSAFIAEQAEKAGTDYILIGGSTHLSSKEMDEATQKIKSRCKVPVIIFPGSSSMFTIHADAIFFMSLLNSADREFIIDHQKKASITVKKSRIESIPMAYLVFAPGMTVGKVGKAMLIGPEQYTDAMEYAVTAELFGMGLIYLEAGSGATYPISMEMISRVKGQVKIPIIVGGGIRSPEAAKNAAVSGADIIVTGTVAEKSENVTATLRPIIDSIKNVK